MKSCLAKSNFSYVGLSNSLVKCCFWQDPDAVQQDVCLTSELGFHGLGIF